MNKKLSLNVTRCIPCCIRDVENCKKIFHELHLFYSNIIHYLCTEGQTRPLVLSHHVISLAYGTNPNKAKASAIKLIVWSIKNRNPLRLWMYTDCDGSIPSI